MKNITSGHITLLTILFSCWALLQLILYLKYNIQTPIDSTLYINNAALLTSGTLPTGKDIWYTSYIVFLAFTFLFQDELWLAVLIQVVLSGVATWCLYHMMMKITKEKISAVLAVLLYLVWIKIHQWNFYIYTESLYTSLTIICLAFLIRNRTWVNYAAAIVIFVFTFFIRPTGINLAIALLSYFFSIFPLRKLTGIGLIIIVVLILNTMLKDFTMIDSYAKAEIIYPGISLGLQPPSEIYVPPPSYSPLVAIVSFAWHNPVYFIKLSGFKLLLFLGNVKPYFSLLHNTLIVLVLYPLYYFAVKGFLHFPVDRKEHIFIATYFIAQALTVALSSENWDGRFLIPVLPFVFMLSAIGLTPLIKKHRWAKTINGANRTV